jgi:integrase
VGLIRAGKVDVYRALDGFVAFLMKDGLAPRTVWNYLSAARGFLRFEDVEVDEYKLRDKITLPPKMEVSVDRIPTSEELRKLLLEADLRLKAMVAVLASSGMRIGELCNLRVGNIDFKNRPTRITILGKFSKSKANRVVRMSDEAANLVKEYLGKRMSSKEEYVFPSTTNPSQPSKRNALAMSLRRLIERCGLLKKLDPESRRYEVHVHCFRKFFFTQLIASGIDRGIAEYWMGHRFGLDSNYLRLNEKALDDEYLKVAPKLTFLSDISPQTSLERELANRDEIIEELRRRVQFLEGQYEPIFRSKYAA